MRCDCSAPSSRLDPSSGAVDCVSCGGDIPPRLGRPETRACLDCPAIHIDGASPCPDCGAPTEPVAVRRGRPRVEDKATKQRIYNRAQWAEVLEAARAEGVSAAAFVRAATDARISSKSVPE